MIATGEGWTLYQGDCLDVIGSLPDASFDAIITDPPYPGIRREYGYWEPDEWLDMMRLLVPELRRVLKPSGSCVMVLQPNSERVGRMRTWLWHFMAWVGDTWGIVQDAYWWNYTALPLAGAPSHGLLRPSVKPCVWLGDATCYRNQNAVLWGESDDTRAMRHSLKAHPTNGHRYSSPSGRTMHSTRRVLASQERGGTTPFNLIPVEPDGWRKRGGEVHGAVTPLELCRWWTRYICPPGGRILDPFCGSGTVGIAALEHGCEYVGIERYAKYVPIAEGRLAQAAAQTRLAV